MDIDIREQHWRTRVTYSVDAPLCEAIDRVLRCSIEVRGGMALERFKFEGADGSAEYKIWLTDGRVWTQALTFDGPGDANPRMTFSAPAGWRMSEFAAQRELRQLCIDLRKSLGMSLFRIDPLSAP